ncbi:MAG TPA: hypothetical protein VMU10_07365 [Desulfomonilia bacterium]|nr:hypothetical protein [Desulfomonilia bacterium]
MAVSSAIKLFAEKYIAEFGHINAIEFDSSNRSLVVELLLRGETEPIILKAAKYEIITDGDRRLILSNEVSASRQWVDLLAKKYLQGRAFEIPAPIAKALVFLS